MIPLVTDSSQPAALAPAAPATWKRNHFHVLFEQRPLDTPETARLRVPFSPPGAAVRASRTDHVFHETARSGAAVATLDLPDELGDFWSPSPQEVSLDPLLAALRQAGLNPEQFRFEQVEAFQPFPTRPEYDYTTRQVLITGPNGQGLFDRDLALRTPWVTAVELRTYGIA
jgi:hypothetical protein